MDAVTDTYITVNLQLFWDGLLIALLVVSIVSLVKGIVEERRRE